MELLTNNLMHNAETEYEEVLEELNRPHKDQVMIASCHLVKKSIGDFMAAFLTEKGAENMVDDDILKMQQACAKFNGEFAKLDLSTIALLCEPTSMIFTNELNSERLQRYVETLKNTRMLVARAIRM